MGLGQFWITSFGSRVCDEHMKVHDIQIADRGASNHMPPTTDVGPCFICETTPVPGRLCEYWNCEKPLHPQWPAVYCSNACAIKDVSVEETVII